MSLLEATCARIHEPDTRIAVEMQRRLDDKTKPRGSLGRLEELACQVAAIRGTLTAQPPRKAVVVMGADHGVAVRIRPWAAPTGHGPARGGCHGVRGGASLEWPLPRFWCQELLAHQVGEDGADVRFQLGPRNVPGCLQVSHDLGRRPPGADHFPDKLARVVQTEGAPPTQVDQDQLPSCIALLN